jgi:uncharacterized protein HemY
MRFDDSVQKAVLAATGWLELGDYVQASNELDRLPPELRAHPEVLKVRCRVYGKAGKWQSVMLVSEGAAVHFPKEPEFVIQAAWAHHHLGHSEAAAVLLFLQADRFSHVAEFAYTLACILTVLSRMTEARDWLAVAIENSSDRRAMKLRALDQPELEKLWTAESAR